MKKLIISFVFIQLWACTNAPQGLTENSRSVASRSDSLYDCSSSYFKKGSLVVGTQNRNGTPANFTPDLKADFDVDLLLNKNIIHLNDDTFSPGDRGPIGKMTANADSSEITLIFDNFKSLTLKTGQANHQFLCKKKK